MSLGLALPHNPVNKIGTYFQSVHILHPPSHLVRCRPRHDSNKKEKQIISILTCKNIINMSWVQWLMSIIQATQEVEMGRIMVHDQPSLQPPNILSEK
jgi:hypothetical protein